LDFQDLISLVITIVVVVIWIASRLRRLAGQKQTPSDSPQEIRPIPPPVRPERPSVRLAPITAMRPPAAGRELPEWKALMDRVVELIDQARRLSLQAEGLAAGVGIKEWVSGFVVDEARRLERELSSLGELESSRIRSGQETLAALEQRLDALREVVAQRREAPHELVLGEMLAQGLMGALTVEESRGASVDVVAVLQPTDSATVETLDRLGLTVVGFPRGWSKRVEQWPEMVSGWVQIRMARMRGLRVEVFQRFGLAPQWPVPYSEPVYVTSTEVLGPFGAWLDVLMADTAACLVLGPPWAEATLKQLQARSSGDSVLKAPVSRSGYYLGSAPPAALRAELLFHLVDRLGAPEAARRMRAGWEEAFGPGEGMWMPTRRGAWYGVPIQPYLDAGTSLLSVLLEEPFTALGNRGLTELEGTDPTEVSLQSVEAWSSAARAGRGVRGSARLRVAAALDAWLSDPGSSERIAVACLAGLVPDVVAVGAHGPLPAGRGLLDLSPEALYEAMVLQAALGPTGWPWRPSFGFSPRYRRRRRPSLPE
jgi:hypothetical protein